MNRSLKWLNMEVLRGPRIRSVKNKLLKPALSHFEQLCREDLGTAADFLENEFDWADTVRSEFEVTLAEVATEDLLWSALEQVWRPGSLHYAGRVPPPCPRRCTPAIQRTPRRPP